MIRCCPSCNSTSTKKNGHIHNGKQNHCCKECGRQFVLNREQILISSAKRERIPLRGICRTEGVSLRWLLVFMVDLYDQLPDDLNLHRNKYLMPPTRRRVWSFQMLRPVR